MQTQSTGSGNIISGVASSSIQKKQRKKKKLARNTNRKPPITPAADLAKILRLRCKLRKDDFDPRFNFKYDEKTTAKFAGQDRGGETYLPPKGFAKLGLNMAKRYPASNGLWLKKQRWPIVYHGTRARPTYIQSIIRDGFKVRGGKDSAVNGEVFGEGIYCSPDPEYAVRYARKHKLDSPHGDEFLVRRLPVPGQARHLHQGARVQPRRQRGCYLARA